MTDESSESPDEPGDTDESTESDRFENATSVPVETPDDTDESDEDTDTEDETPFREGEREDFVRKVRESIADFEDFHDDEWRADDGNPLIAFGMVAVYRSGPESMSVKSFKVLDPSVDPETALNAAGRFNQSVINLGFKHGIRDAVHRADSSVSDDPLGELLGL